MIASTLKKAIEVKKVLDDVKKILKILEPDTDGDTDDQSLYISTGNSSMRLYDPTTITIVCEALTKYKNELQLKFDSL